MKNLASITHDTNVHLKKEKPSWLQTIDELQPQDYKLETSSGVKYLLVNEQHYVENHQVTKFRKTLVQAITMDGIEEASKILINFHPKAHTILIHEIIIQRQGEDIDRLFSTEMHLLRREIEAERNILSGELTLSVILDDVRINDAILFSHSMINNYEFWVRFYNIFLPLEYGAPLYQLSLRIILNKNIPFHYKFLGNTDEVETVEQSECSIFSLNKINIPQKKVKKNLPPWDWQFSYLQAGITTTWKEIASNYSKYFYCPEIHQPALLSFIHENKIQDFDDEIRVLKILDFINKNIRYLANSTVTDFITPVDPNTTFTRAYGDCKSFVFLMHSLLTIFKIESHPVLVHTTFGKKLNTVLPNATLFNHVIILVNIDHKKYFIDPTIRQEVDSLENLFLFELGYGLVCANDTEKLSYIDEQMLRRNYVFAQDEYNILSWEKNETLFKSHIIYQGMPTLKLKKSCESEESREKIWENSKLFYERFYAKINRIIKSEIDDSQLKNNQLKLTYHALISLNFFNKLRNKYKLEIMPMDLLEHIVFILPTDREKDTDFYYGPLMVMDYKIEVYDHDFKPSKDIIKEIINDESFILWKETEWKKGQLIIKYRFEKLKDIILAEEYPQFSENHAQAIKLMANQVYSNKKKKSIFESIVYIFVITLLIAGFCKNHPMSSDRTSNPQPSSTLLPYANNPNGTYRKAWWEQYLDKKNAQ